MLESTLYIFFQASRGSTWLIPILDFKIVINLRFALETALVMKIFLLLLCYLDLMISFH